MIPVDLARGAVTMHMHVYAKNGNATIRLLREERGEVTLQICRNGRCYEASVDPNWLARAVVDVAGDALRNTFIDMLENAKAAMWMQLLVNRAVFLNALNDMHKLGVTEREKEDALRRAEWAAKKLVRLWHAYLSLERLMEDLRDKPDEEYCRGRDECIEAAREVSRLIDERLKVPENVKQVVYRRR